LRNCAPVALCIGFTPFHLFVVNAYSLEPLYVWQRYRGRGAASA